MKFPYGLCDFQRVVREGYFYADRTDRIALVEEAGDHLLLLRPRRFGKSLWLSTLENYYDVAKAGAFAELFGGLAIGAQPTPRHNRYLVMKWDFSMVKAVGSVEAIEAALHDHINGCVEACAVRYRDYLSHPIVFAPGNGIRTLQSLLAAMQTTPYKLYLLIDEYDNFANEVMSERRGDYAALVHGEGILKTVFKAVKALSAGQGLERVFITGVSPVVMSDIGSGYNVAEELSLDGRFADLCGFTEAEVAAGLAQVAERWGLEPSRRAEAMEMMRTFYNGYRFGYGPSEPIYNPTLVLYFLKALATTGAYPREMLDGNLAMDRNRIRYVGALPHGQELIGRALDPADPPVVGQLANRFGVEEMASATRDQPFLASLLYYLGALTMAEPDAMGRLVLRVPNLVIRRLYLERMQDVLLPAYEDKEAMRKAAEYFYSKGALGPVCELIESRYFRVFDNRDYRWSNELVVKTAFLVVLFSDTFYIMDSEPVIARGYGDLSLIVRPDMRRFALLDHLLEFKYLPLKELGLSGEEVRSRGREALAELPLVAARLREAEAQLAQDRAALEQRYGERLRLHTHAVVGLGFERLVWRSEPGSAGLA